MKYSNDLFYKLIVFINATKTNFVGRNVKIEQNRKYNK